MGRTKFRKTKGFVREDISFGFQRPRGSCPGKARQEPARWNYPKNAYPRSTTRRASSRCKLSRNHYKLLTLKLTESGRTLGSQSQYRARRTVSAVAGVVKDGSFSSDFLRG